VINGLITEIDVYYKDPVALATVLAENPADAAAVSAN
jgi:hypothetical protein